MQYTTLCLVVGFTGGALFGVAFGAIGSLFENGPELAVGVAESWLWFAGVGTVLGIGVAFSRLVDQARDASDR